MLSFFPPEIVNVFIEGFSESSAIFDDKGILVFHSNGFKKLLPFTIEKGENLIDRFSEFGFQLKSHLALVSKENSVETFFSFKTESLIMRLSVHVKYIIKLDKVTYYGIFIQENVNIEISRAELLKRTLSIERLSKSRKVLDGYFGEAIYEILENASLTSGVQRVNAWQITPDGSEIKCIGSYDAAIRKFISEENLPKRQIPHYFNAFSTERIIVATDARHDARTKELTDIYLQPYHIYSLMDVPIRVKGELIGVVCFENVDFIREWNFFDQTYGLVVANMIALAIESHQHQLSNRRLQDALDEQKNLVKEIHHRVKNNLAIIASLINLQSEKARDEYHMELFKECRDRINSMAEVHKLLYDSKSFSNLNFRNYIRALLENLMATYCPAGKRIITRTELDDVFLDISTAVPLGLILNEIITNSFKHAFGKANSGIIFVTLHASEEFVILTIGDNGSGFDIEAARAKYTLGMEIIDGLIEQIGGTLTYNGKSGSSYEIKFKNPLGVKS